MRKRSPYRPRPVPSVPPAFAFPTQVKTLAMTEARLAADAVINGLGDAVDLAMLVRIAEYCNRMGEAMMLRDDIEPDGLADVADAVRRAAPVLRELAGAPKAGALFEKESGAINNLIDAYEAVFTTATRRESMAALARTA